MLRRAFHDRYPGYINVASITSEADPSCGVCRSITAMIIGQLHVSLRYLSRAARTDKFLARGVPGILAIPLFFLLRFDSDQSATIGHVEAFGFREIAISRARWIAKNRIREPRTRVRAFSRCLRSFFQNPARSQEQV